MKKRITGFAGLFLALAAIVVSVNACRKERPDTDTQSSIDNSICEGEFARLFPQTNSIAVNDSGVQKWGGPSAPFSACPDYHIDSVDNGNGFPKTLWMFYGQDGDGDSIYEIPCTSSDGKVRKGVVKAVFDRHLNLPGAVVTHILDNYYVNDLRYEGTLEVVHSGTIFNQTVTDGKCSKGSEWSILWECNRSVDVQIGDQFNPYDDYTVTSGTASGTDRKGRAFSVDIDGSNPLRREMGCPYIVKGIQTIKLEGKKDRIINYGDGTCDNIATLTIDGNDFEFKLQ